MPRGYPPRNDGTEKPSQNLFGDPELQSGPRHGASLNLFPSSAILAGEKDFPAANLKRILLILIQRNDLGSPGDRKAKILFVPFRIQGDLLVFDRELGVGGRRFKMNLVRKRKI